MPMAPNNARQALILDRRRKFSRITTAPRPDCGFRRRRTISSCFPDRHPNLKPMFEKACAPRFQKLAGDIALARRIFRTTGLGESSWMRASRQSIRSTRTSRRQFWPSPDRLKSA